MKNIYGFKLTTLSLIAFCFLLQASVTHAGWEERECAYEYVNCEPEAVGTYGQGYVVFEGEPQFNESTLVYDWPSWHYNTDNDFVYSVYYCSWIMYYYVTDIGWDIIASTGGGVSATLPFPPSETSPPDLNNDCPAPPAFDVNLNLGGPAPGC